jgi:DNA-binding ferritin-like protein
MIFISIMIVTNLLTLHNQLKIHHWQTKSYAEHQALGGAYNEFSELIDEFVEVFMGKYGRIESKDGFKIELSNYKDISAVDFVDKYIDYLINELPKSLVETDTDLFNIRDEMLAQLHKLKYLLTLS